MIANKKEFYGGSALLAAFFIVLFVIFMPVFNGHNGLNYLDSLYNSISKGSAYYIPKTLQDVKAFDGQNIDVTLSYPTAAMAGQASVLFNKSGALINTADKAVKVSGDLGKILTTSLEDSDALYANKDQDLNAKYGFSGREVLYNWWFSLNEMDKELKKQENFREAKMINQVVTRAVETAYNYYGIEAQKISEKWGIVLFSLVFYVIYTLWYGFAILFMFEGWGLKLESH